MTYMSLYPLATGDTYGTIPAVTTVPIIIHFFGHVFNYSTSKRVNTVTMPVIPDITVNTVETHGP